MGHTHTTKRIGRWVLKKFFPCVSLEEARTLEHQIKKSKNVSRWLAEQPRTR
ncbi:hypothetical protein HY213_01395 [Candidatus Peregrinibacteria bacterium]|nr:hypothetical protein [Candidatus Peregrinibacteria bacterium]